MCSSVVKSQKEKSRRPSRISSMLLGPSHVGPAGNWRWA